MKKIIIKNEYEGYEDICPKCEFIIQGRSEEQVNMWMDRHINTKECKKGCKKFVYSNQSHGKKDVKTLSNLASGDTKQGGKLIPKGNTKPRFERRALPSADNHRDNHSEPELYLFVWKDVLTDWTSGMAFAIAEDLEQALKVLNKQAGYPLELPVEKMKKYKISELKEPIGEFVYGGG